MIRLETRIIHKYLLRRLSCYFRNHILVKYFWYETLKNNPGAPKKIEKLLRKLKKINKINKIKWDFQVTTNQLIFEIIKSHKINK